MAPARVSTAEILARRALELTCGQECVDWAIALLIEGRDSADLRMLAGASSPHNHFDLAALRDRALQGLGEAPVSPEEAIRLFARERLRAATGGQADLLAEIEALAQLYIATYYARDLYDFYLLHNAYLDLQTSEEDQHYWPDADRSNILAIMKRRAEEFVMR